MDAAPEQPDVPSSGAASPVATGPDAESPVFTVMGVEDAELGLSQEDHDEFVRLDMIVRHGFDAFMQAGEALDVIRGRELWRAGGYESWAAYCLDVGGLSKVHANRMIRACETVKRLQVEPIGSTLAILPRTEWQVRPLYLLKDPGQHAAAWSRAVDLAAGAQPTAVLVRQAVDEIAGTTVRAETPKPSRRRLLEDAYARLVDATESQRPYDEIKRLAVELGGLLKLTPNPAE